MKVEIWADIVCPWCYVGKRRFEEALALFAHRDEVEVTYRSFELDPDAPHLSDKTMVDYLAHKLSVAPEQALKMIAHTMATAAGAGLDLHIDEALPANSFDAHRLLHFSREHGLAMELQEKLYAAHFTEGRAIGDKDVLVHIAAEVGLDEALARKVMDEEAYADDVRLEEQTAAELGIRAVPFFVVDRRYGVSGAQNPDVLLDVLQDAWSESHPTE